MALFKMTPDALEAVPTTSFATESVKERQDLQRLLRRQLDLIDKDLLFVAEEYGSFQDSRRRIDLLALDHSGQLAVIELKRTDDGGHMELQALRYAAMVSTMTFDQLVDTFATQNKVTDVEARQTLEEWLVGESPDGADDELPTLADKVRIVLVAANFSPEITSTVLWLNQQYALDIRCFRLVPYNVDGQLLVDLQQLIPLAEAADFQIKQRDKNIESAAARASSKDYTKYDVILGTQRLEAQSKQGAIWEVVHHLVQSGIPGHEIRAVLTPRRWVAVTPLPGEDVEEAFHRQYPERGSGYWFDIGMSDSAGAWVMPRLGGTKTERYLDALVGLASTKPNVAAIAWERSAG